MQDLSGSYQRDQLALDQLRIVASNLKPNVVMMPLLASLICAMFSQWTRQEALFAWWGLVLVAGLPLHFVSRQFSRTERPAGPGAWIALFCAVFLIFELAWGSLAVLLWVPDNDFDHVLIMLIIGSTLAGNCVLAGASAEVTLAGFLIYGPAMVMTPLRSGGMVYDTVAMATFVFVVFLLYMARVYHGVARSMLLLREEKRSLIDRLEIALHEATSAREHAESANLAKSRFLANMSHELRTPLNAIIGFSEAIRDEIFEPVGERYRDFARDIYNSGKHLLRLINDVLDLSKIESGRVELHEEKVDIGALIEACLPLVKQGATGRGIGLTVSVPRDLLIFVDERRLKQIILNLLSNAIKFTGSGGKVTLSAAQESDGSVAIRVADTGIGMRSEEIPLALEPFRQVDGSLTRRHEGTGLGLPLAKQLAELHGGSLRVESQIDAGTTVCVRLPPSRAIQAAA